MRRRTALLVAALALAASGAGAGIAAATGRSRLIVKPSLPTASSTITVTFKVPAELPKGHLWILGLADGLNAPQPCATYAVKAFFTRGRKGQILTASFRPQDDFVDTNPTVWCTGLDAASVFQVIAASATVSGTHFTSLHIRASTFVTIYDLVVGA